MASKRATELRASLVRELEAVSQREGYSQLARLIWLRNELENYLDRWLGFVALDETAISSLFQSDLFTMILVASDVYEQELGKGESKRSEAEWRQFRANFARAQSARSLDALVGLRESLVAVGKALHG